MKTEIETIATVVEELAPHDFTTRSRILQYLSNWSGHKEDLEAVERRAKELEEKNAQIEALNAAKAAAEPPP